MTTKMAGRTEASSEEIRRRIQAWVGLSKKLRVLLSGKTGAGKSSLINTLLGKNVAVEGGSIFAETRAVGSHTTLKNKLDLEHRMIINNIQVTLWDTPGLNDPSTDKVKTLMEIQEKCRDQVDLFVYCIQMTQTRAGQDEYDAIADFTKVLGVDVWKNAVFALTFANEVHPPLDCEDSPEMFFKNRLESWEKVIRDALEKAGVPWLVATKVPIVPTSYRQQPILVDQKWFANFWSACLYKMKFLSIPAILTVSHSDEESVIVKSRNAVNARLIAERLKQIGDDTSERVRETLTQDEWRRIDPEFLAGVPSTEVFRILSEEILIAVRSDDVVMSTVTSVATAAGYLYKKIQGKWKILLVLGCAIGIGLVAKRYVVRR